MSTRSDAILDLLGAWRSTAAARRMLAAVRPLMRSKALRARRARRLAATFVTLWLRHEAEMPLSLSVAGARRCVAVSIEIGDPLLQTFARTMLATALINLGRLKDGLNEATAVLHDTAGVGQGDRALAIMINGLSCTAAACTEMGWHDRARAVMCLARLAVDSRNSAVLPPGWAFPQDDLHFAATAVLDLESSGRAQELSLARAHLQQSLERLPPPGSGYAFARFDGLQETLWRLAGREGGLSPSVDVLAGPDVNRAVVTSDLEALVNGLECSDAAAFSAALQWLQVAKASWLPGEMALRQVCFLGLSRALAGLGRWQEALEMRLRADELTRMRRDESVHLRLDALLGRLRRDSRITHAYVNHDLRTPLTAIRTLARSDSPLESQALRRVGELADSALAYIDHYLCFVELDLLQPAHFRPVDLADVVADVIEEWRLAQPLRPEVNVVEDYDDRDLQVLSHFTTLRRVFTNLVWNAARAAGSQVRVEVQRRGADVLVSVTDDGRGFSAQLLPILFDDELSDGGSPVPGAEGHGLGLRFVRRAVHALGGRVLAINPVGGGAAVHVSLPARQPLPGQSALLHRDG